MAITHLPAPAGRTREVLRKLGFGLGAIVVALILIGQIIFVLTTRNAMTSARLPSAAALHGSGLHRQLDELLAAALGPSDRSVRRFTVSRIAPDPHVPGWKEVVIRWAINDDLSQGTIGNGAQFDVYNALHALYAANLPISLVWLYGTYPLPDARGRLRETVVMRLSMDRKVADTVGKVGWDTLDPQTFWPLVTRWKVLSQFQPLQGE